MNDLTVVGKPAQLFFAGLVAIAIWQRHRPDYHKRLMYYRLQATGRASRGFPSAL